MSVKKNTIRISSRKSDLARLQSYLVAEALLKKNPLLNIEFLFKESLGDINLTDPLWKIPEKGVFTQDFYQDLIEKKTDLVVHSWKDLPTEIKADCEIIATLPRADQRDILLVKKSNLENIKKTQSILIFSSSPRRFYNIEPFLKNYFPGGLGEVHFESVRGNIPTRLNKFLDSKNTDGIILAKAAIDRLLSSKKDEFSQAQATIRKALSESLWMVFPLSENPNAAAQGALAIEIKKDNHELKNILTEINDIDGFNTVTEERNILSSYGGGCHQKIGVSVLNHKYGKVKIVKGFTDSQEVLNIQTLENNYQSLLEKKYTVLQIWCSEKNNIYFNRTILNWNLNTDAHSDVQNIFISKANCLTDQDFNKIKNIKVLWAAGLQTWKKLAGKGYWINGCSEGLGEKSLLSVNDFISANNSWIKLSHNDGEIDSMKTIPTYKLERNKTEFNFKDIECFFWNSGSLFLAAVKEHPEILNKIHCCGPGNTSDIIKKKLDQYLKTDSLWKKLFIFMNEENWRSFVTK